MIEILAHSRFVFPKGVATIHQQLEEKKRKLQAFLG